MLPPKANPGVPSFRCNSFPLGISSLIFIVPFIGGMIFYTLGFVVYLLKPNTTRQLGILLLQPDHRFLHRQRFRDPVHLLFRQPALFHYPLHAGLPFSYRHHLPREKTDPDSPSLAGVSDLSPGPVFGRRISTVLVHLFLGQPAGLDPPHFPGNQRQPNLYPFLCGRPGPPDHPFPFQGLDGHRPPSGPV